MLLRPATLSLSAHSIGETTDTHAALAMARESILASEACTTRALVWLVPRVDLRMALQIVLSHEALSAAIALELAITKMCLDVGADVLSSAKHLPAILVKTRPLAGSGILLADVSQDFFRLNARVLEAGVYVHIVEQGRLLVWIDGERKTVHGHRALRQHIGLLREEHIVGRVLLNLLEE
jgi:hypothetical protein